MSGVNAELSKTVRAPHLFRRWECRTRFERFDFSGDLAIVTSRVERSDAVNAAGSFDQLCPGALDIVSQRCDDTHPGNYNSSFFVRHDGTGVKKRKGQPDRLRAAALQIAVKLLLLAL